MQEKTIVLGNFQSESQQKFYLDIQKALLEEGYKFPEGDLTIYNSSKVRGRNGRAIAKLFKEGPEDVKPTEELVVEDAVEPITETIVEPEVEAPTVEDLEAALRAEAKELGLKVGNVKNLDTLQSKIDEAKAASK